MSKKLKNLKQVDGKKEQFKPTTLDQLWGDTGISKYKTLDENEYSRQLVDYNKSDLQAHAISMGLVPVDDRERLTQRLIKEFRKHINNYRTPDTLSSKQGSVSDDVKRILDEGR
jgi:hypothetical protein